MKRLKWLILPVIVFGLTFCLFRFVLIIGYVPSASMEPTLKEKSYILGVRIYDDLEVGDIIIFEHNGTTMVKRIAAVGGETIYVDGKTYIVPEGSLFMLGDNTENSFDSRYWDEPFVNENQVIAKVLK
jgi:signal peptidase I